MAEVNVQTVKCACPDCVCVFDAKGGIEKDGKLYCSDVCASDHADGSEGCGHEGCGCGGKH